MQTTGTPAIHGGEDVSRSSYCPAHHRLCHLPRGSRQERREMRRWDRLARAPMARLRAVLKQTAKNR